MPPTETQTIFEGRFLRLARRGTWEFATRKGCTGVVAIVALTPQDKLVLVEQERPPVGGSVLELPAGLVGDVEDTETLLQAAQRELEEETGYVARSWAPLFRGLSSAGLTDETVTFYLARDLERTGPGGGDESERITVHEVELPQVLAWLESKTAEGRQLDIKLLAGLFAALESMRKDHGS